MAARIRRELQIEVEMVHGGYGEFKVIVDGETVIDAGPLAAVGLLPRGRKVVETVRQALSRSSGA